MSHDNIALLLPARKLARKAPDVVSKTCTIESAPPVATKLPSDPSYLDIK